MLTPIVLKNAVTSANSQARGSGPGVLRGFGERRNLPL
jgi:hypothetical protein